MLLKMQYELNFYSWSILVIKNGFLDPKLVGTDTQLDGFILKVNQAIYMTFQGQKVTLLLNYDRVWVYLGF